VSSLDQKPLAAQVRSRPPAPMMSAPGVRDYAEAKRPDHSWATPDETLLEDRRGELPEFPSDVFPPPLSSWLLRAARGAGVQIDHIAIPMLGVASSLIGKARRIQASTSWIEPTTLWSCVVGQSGDRKTPGLQVILRALDRIEEENSPQQRAAEHAHMLRAERAKATLKAWRKQCQKALSEKPPREPPRMPMEAVDPGDFIHPALYVSNSTIERLGRLCEVRPRGMLQIRDELSGLFAGMARQPEARGFYLECWNGNKHVVERVDGTRSLTVMNLLVGIVGGFQPDKLARAFAGDEDGMYARFLFGWPVTPAYTPLNDGVGEIDSLFQHVLTQLIRLPDEDEGGKFAPRIIPLSHDAREEFESYRVFVDQIKRGIEGREQQWLVKSESQVLRLASALTYLDWASLDDVSGTGVGRINASMEPDEVSASSMVAATKLLREYFWPHARACLAQIGLSDRHRDLRRVLRWIAANNRPVVSLKDVRRECLGGSRDAEQTRDLRDRLVGAGWLRLEKTNTGGRPKELWLVNPKLFETAETAGTAESPRALSV
jgi:Protein of unknown function (DUF3987)